MKSLDPLSYRRVEIMRVLELDMRLEMPVVVSYI